MHIRAIGVAIGDNRGIIGWNYGWQTGATAGLCIATLIITVLYFTFIFCFTKLTAAMPNTDESRNCISNIRADAPTPKDTATKMVQRVCAAFTLQLTGVGLKDNNGNNLIR